MNKSEGLKPIPDSLPQNEVTVKVQHPTTKNCELSGKMVEITFNPLSYGSFNLDERTHCPRCDIALI